MGFGVFGGIGVSGFFFLPRACASAVVVARAKPAAVDRTVPKSSIGATLANERIVTIFMTDYSQRFTRSDTHGIPDPGSFGFFPREPDPGSFGFLR